MVVRTAQIRTLNENYEAQGNSIVLLYGREGCEKEALFRVYVKEKKHFYYHARQASELEQYRQMAAEVEKKYETKLQKDTYEELFNRIKSGNASKLVVIIDEFQYIVRKNPDFMDAVIKLRDKKLYPGPVQIILSSSDVAWVEQEFPELIGEQMKKIKETIKLQELSFLDLVRSYPDLSVKEVVQIYGVIGGVSSYVSRWNPKVDFKTNVCRNVLSPYGYLHNQAEEYISSRLRELAVYDTILAAISAGNRKLNDLYHITGFSRAKISVYLKNLMEIDVIEKAVSFETGGQRNAQKGLYQIRDHFVNFWFHFIYPHLSDLYVMKAEEFYDTYIAPDIEEYMNRYFVEVCVEYLELMNLVDKLPISIKKIGTWIGKQGTIDIVAQDEVRNTMVGACNWSKPIMNAEDLTKLAQALKKAKLAPKHIFLFTATEFAPEVFAVAERDPHFTTVDMNQL